MSNRALVPKRHGKAHVCLRVQNLTLDGSMVGQRRAAADPPPGDQSAPAERAQVNAVTAFRARRAARAGADVARPMTWLIGAGAGLNGPDDGGLMGGSWMDEEHFDMPDGQAPASRHVVDNPATATHVGQIIQIERWMVSRNRGAAYGGGGDSDEAASDEELQPYECPRSAIVAQTKSRAQLGLRPGDQQTMLIHPSVNSFESWHSRIGENFDLAYMEAASRDASRATGESESATIPETSCDCGPTDRRRSKYSKTLRVYDIGRPYQIKLHSCRRHSFITLIRIGLFPATPSRPQVAFSMRLLRWYHTLIDQAGLGASNMALTVESFVRRGVTFRGSREAFSITDTLRKQLRSATTWMTVVDRYASSMAVRLGPVWNETRPPLGEDDLALTLDDLVESCPACFYDFKMTGVGPKYPDYGKGPQVIISLDGNFTQKRRCRDDSVGRQPFPPRRFLSERQVQEEEAMWQAAGGTSPDKLSCIANIRAIDTQAAQSADSPFDITGVMGACCRHGVPLVMCDMRTPGERHYFATALIRAIVLAVGKRLRHLGVAYDIGCRFDPSGKVKHLLGELGVQVTWAVPVFHVYGHTVSCKHKFSPCNLEGFGLVDGEGMERVWSSMTNLIGTHRSMSEGERRFSLEERCDLIARDRRLDLPRRLIKWIARLGDEGAQAREHLKLHFDVTKVPLRFRRANSAHVDRRLAAEFSGVSKDKYISLARMNEARRQDLDELTMRRRKLTVGKENAVAIFASDLMRILGEIQELSKDMRDRPNTVAKGYKATVRLSLALKGEKKAARKAMKLLNNALAERVTQGHAHQLVEAKLFKPETFELVETMTHWDDNSEALQPWWTKGELPAALNAFNLLTRISEERGRIKAERITANTWLKGRIAALKPLAATHAVYEDALGDARLLESHWAGEADNRWALLPRGAVDEDAEGKDKIDHDDNLEELTLKLAGLSYDIDEADDEAALEPAERSTTPGMRSRKRRRGSV